MPDAERIFVIQEVVVTRDAADADLRPARFEWTATREATTTQGGARACPTGSWALGGRLLRSRTDYPGSPLPSEQVLSAVQKDHHFVGEWNDKWNKPGYAAEEMQRFEDMVRRGNRVQISFESQAFEGVIYDWEFQYKGAWQIQYSFNFSVHTRIAAKNTSTARQPQHVPNAAEALDVISNSTQELIDLQDGMPRGSLVGDLPDLVDAALAGLVDARNRAAGALADAPFGTSGQSVADVLDRYRKMGAQLRAVEHEAAELCNVLLDARSDVTVGWQSVDTFFDLEKWSRATRYMGRAAMGQADAAASVMEAEAKPPAKRTYQAHAGESLYAIAARFYGDPGAWSFLAAQNQLSSPVLREGKLLTIPLQRAP